MIGMKLLTKIKHANVITELSEDEILKMPIVLNLCKFNTFKLNVYI